MTNQFTFIFQLFSQRHACYRNTYIYLFFNGYPHLQAFNLSLTPTHTHEIGACVYVCVSTVLPRDPHLSLHLFLHSHASSVHLVTSNASSLSMLPPFSLSNRACLLGKQSADEQCEQCLFSIIGFGWLHVMTNHLLIRVWNEHLQVTPRGNSEM